VRRGAASCRAVLGSCPVAAAARAAAQVPSPRSRHGWPSAPRRHDVGEVGPPSGCRRSRDVRTPAASSGPPWGCPSNRSSGRPASRCPVSGVRCPAGQALVSAPLPCPRRAGPGVARCGGPPRPGAAGRRAAVVCGRRGRLPASVLTGRRWCGVGRGWLARGSTVAQGRHLAGVPAAAPPWPQRADTGAGPGQGAGRVAGSMGQSRCSPAPAGRPRQVVGVVLTMGLDQEVVTTLRGRWVRVVRWRPASEGPLGSVGEQAAAAARPQRVRSAVP
jgi:hypothetical protein